jgi:hypothetical protein
MNRGPYSGSVKILLATLTVFASTVVLGQAPANASVSITYTIEANTPNVSIAYAPGQWQRYELRYSNLAGRYALGLNTRPATRPKTLYIAAKGRGLIHCRIRVAGAVVAVDNSPNKVICRAGARSIPRP